MTDRADGPIRGRIAADLRARIASGALAPGEQIPSERELAEEFGAARMTARAAVDQLRAEGLVDNSGPSWRGTVVSTYRPLVTWLNLAERGARLDNPDLALDDWEANVRRQGRNPRQVVRVHLDVPAPVDVARWLDLPPGAPVTQRHRWREVDGVASQVVDSWFPDDVARAFLPGTDRQPLREEGNVVLPRGILFSIGHAQTAIDRRWTARNADPETARDLGVPVGAALLVDVWIGFRADGRRVRVMATTAVGSRNVFADRIEL